MKPIIILIAILLTGCDQYDYGYDIDDLEFNFETETIEVQASDETRYVRTFPKGITLHMSEDSKPWQETVNVYDEPGSNYCAPTAVKNLLSWYGINLSYELLGQEMETNNWEPGFNVWASCAGACMGEVAICANACYSIVKNNIKGTSISNTIATLNRYKPYGYELKYIAGDPDQVENIIHQLLQGNPVMINEVIEDGVGVSHLSVLTGIKIKEDGEIYVALANSPNKSLDEFMEDWSIKSLGSKFIRSVARKFGQRPFTAMYFNRVHGF